MRLPPLLVILGGVMYAQPTIQIHPNAAAQALGVEMVSINDPGHAQGLAQILASDAAVMAPLLPYSVLVSNGAAKSLAAIGVQFRWAAADGSHPGKIVVLTSLHPTEAGSRTPPGALRLFTPVQAVNQYLGLQAAKRQGFLRSGQSIALAPNGGGSISQTLEASQLPTLISQQTAALAGASAFHAMLECIVFDDMTYVGSDNLLTSLQRGYPNIHR